MCLGLAQAYQAMFDSTQRPQGKRTLNLTMWQQTLHLLQPQQQAPPLRHPWKLLCILQVLFHLLCIFVFPRMNQSRNRLVPEIWGLAKSPYSKITLLQTEKPIKVIYGLDNSAISTCSSLHRWSSVECILLLKLSWRYWESWLWVKEMSKPSSSAKLSAMNTECTGEQREDLSFTSQSLASSAVIFNFPWNCIQT